MKPTQSTPTYQRLSNDTKSVTSAVMVWEMTNTTNKQPYFKDKLVVKIPKVQSFFFCDSHL
jgi:hypothetical protein